MSRSEREVNPYEAPGAVAPFSADGLTEVAYADGGDLVFRSDFVSPRVCFVTGEDVARHVEPLPLPIHRFYLKNYVMLKLLYVVLFALYFLNLFFPMVEGWFFNPIFLLMTVHAVPVLLRKKSNVDFYCAEYLRVNETKKVWKQSLVILVSVAFLTYGMTSKSYLFAVVGLMMILTFVMIVQSGSLVKVRRGDKRYYRIGEVHPRLLARYPNVDGSDMGR
ncbi:MAG: hypothetical protein ACSHX6_09925 [Akkermansiaceae bacterium]